MRLLFPEPDVAPIDDDTGPGTCRDSANLERVERAEQRCVRDPLLLGNVEEREHGQETVRGDVQEAELEVLDVLRDVQEADLRL